MCCFTSRVDSSTPSMSFMFTPSVFMRMVIFHDHSTAEKIVVELLM